MATTWTPERRARQSELIRNWKPWVQSTGPRSAEGKAVAARNAFKGGLSAQLRQIRQAIREHQVMLKSMPEFDTKTGKTGFFVVRSQ